MPRSIEGRIRRWLSPVKAAITKPIREQAIREVGLTPNGTFDPQDIFIVAYPKSGITWFRSIVAQLVFGVDAQLAPFSLQRLIVPDVHKLKHYRRFATPMYFKTHRLPQPAYRRVVYLVRDGRDVMVSYRHFMATRRKQQIELNQLVDGSVPIFVGPWHEHVEAWLSNPYQAEMIVIKYEDLKHDPVLALGRFCDFAGVTRSREQIEAVMAATDFARMQAKEKEEGAFEARWPKDQLFNRRGQVGSYKDEMPEDLRAQFEATASSALRKCGYV